MNQYHEDTNTEILDAIRKQYAANGINLLEPGADTSASSFPDEEGQESQDPLQAEVLVPSLAVPVPTAPDTRDQAKAQHVMSNEGAIKDGAQKDYNKEGLTKKDDENGQELESSGRGNSTTTVEARPGAYAEAFEGGDQPLSSTAGGDWNQGSHQPTTLNGNDDVPVAKAVSDEEQGQSRLDLPQAESIDSDDNGTRSNPTNDSRKKPLSQSSIRLGCGSLVVLGIVSLMVVLVVGKNRNNMEDATSNETLNPPTEALSPSALREAQVLSLFPDYTMEALQDSETPQSMAMEWLMNDPQLDTYVDMDWRVRQRFALATLYHATNEEGWDVDEHWLSYEQHECTWWTRPWFAPPSPGFFFINVEQPNPCECENVTETIIPDETAEYKHLWLLKNKLQGSIPEEIFWLTSLRSISLSLNPLHGTLSTRLGLLTNLEALTLSRNDVGLTGTLPTELEELSKLTLFSVMGNRLTGDITVLGKLSRLQTVMVDWNDFTGKIPSQLGEIKSLVRLYLDGNSFTGGLPTELGQLHGLLHLFVDGNNLSGTVPSEFGLLQSLQRLGLKNNSFTGTLCTELGLLSSLMPIELQDNQFTGWLPSQLGLLPNVTHILAQNNQLTGLPVAIRDMLPVSNTTRSSLLALNVTNNPLSEGPPQDVLCWVNDTFFEGDICSEYPGRFLSPSCECMCTCPLQSDTSWNANMTT